MARNFIPWGRLRDGKMGILVETGTSNPLVAATEILASLPGDADLDNFEGRCVYSIANKKIYVFDPGGSVKWIPLEGGYPTVGAVDGSPPTVPIPRVGETYYDTDTEILYLWDGSGYWIKPGVNYAAQIVTQRFTGNGSETTYVLGTADMINVNYVEVFVDGVRCYPNPTGDYDVLGTVVVFSTPPANGTLIMIRTLIARSVTQNSQILSTTVVATASQTDFDLPESGIDPASVFVYENGVFRGHGADTNDWQITSQNTRITTIAKVSPVLAEVTCEDPHEIVEGQSVLIRGTSRDEYNTTFVVASVMSSTVFRITVATSVPNSAVGNPTMFWGPPTILDTLVFNSGRTLNNVIQIRVLKNVVVSGAAQSLIIPVSSAAHPGVYTPGSANTGFYTDGTGMLGITSVGVSVMEIDNDGSHASVIFKKNDAIRIPAASTGNRPATPGTGDFRGNTTKGYPEYYNGSSWLALLGLKGFASVVFDGTQSVGTLTTLAGVNIGSVVKTGVGQYTINFSPAFSTANYVVMGMGQYDTTSGAGMDVKVSMNNITNTTGICYIQVTAGTSGVTYDAYRVILLFLEF